MTSTALVITVGQSKHESLGALKLASWLRSEGYEVTEATKLCPLLDSGFDLYCFSAVFSWWLPRLCEYVNQAKAWGEVWIGGPAVTFHHRNLLYVWNRTGIKPSKGIDDRFETQPGTYPMVYFSRGCPAYTKACGLCPVPEIEGNDFRFYPDARPAKLLLDNNLSALPISYQDHIIKAYRDHYRGRSLVDANSGFEPHTFDGRTLERWQRFPLRCWRFGYDDLSERTQALEMMQLLQSKGYGGEKVRVYTLIGNEPMEDCYQRVREVIEHGMHPWPQRLRPLDYLGGPLPCRHDWDEATLIAFQHFYGNAGLWKRLKPREFVYQGRKPLAGLS